MGDASRTKRPLLKDLPQWFFLEKYKRTEGLDPLGWERQICVRRVCSSQLYDMRESERIFPERDGLVQQALASLRENPICDLSRSPFDHQAFSFCRAVDFRGARAVRSMTLWELYTIDCRVRERLSQGQIDIIVGIARVRPHAIHGFLYPKWLKAAVEDELSWANEIPLMIDLSFPNSLLKQQFDTHLQQLRRRRGGRPTGAAKRSPDFKEWAKIGVLPCMDLLLWAEEKEGSIASRLIADGLGSESDADEEKVRKTIRPLAAGLLDLRGSDASVELIRLRALAHADWSHRQLVRHARKARK